MLRTPTLLLTTLALGCSFELNNPTPQHDAGPGEIVCGEETECVLGQLATGQRHTCIVVGEDALCFGDNAHGQSRPELRDVIAAMGPVDQRVDSPGGLPSFSAGMAHTCATYWGYPICWGRADIVGGAPSPRLVSRSDGVWNGIQTGTLHQCWTQDTFDETHTPQRQVMCSGAWDGARFGVAAPEPVAIELPVAQHAWVGVVHVGGFRTCTGVFDPDEVREQTWCWGGVPPEGPWEDGAWREAPHPEPLADRGISALGATHACAIPFDGRDHESAVECWGENDHGELGVPPGEETPDARVRVPFELQTPSRVCVGGEVRVDDGIVSYGASHTCAVDQLGVVCWGSNDRGQSGAPPSEGALSPRRVEGPTQITALACGGAHTCATTLTNELWCWGANDHGQLGSPPSEPLAPHRVTLRW
ncbi:RCC1 domain-containing protein [Sandaracinus amylolyticus]|uniref:RCC1 domain-containing protein n=1 Tax=Sandaracinus amylolyticus TaxID=927083 RepID=UPI001F20B2F1|nr:hypothetical protein [Sandaracinus amylolyticus]UJR87159.1 Hypothetical protein I5071_92600 [Sandaracinus amylolyticus]